MKVAFFDYKAVFNDYPGIEAELLRVFESGQYILGDDLLGFETDVSDLFGYPRFLGVADGTNAIQLGLAASGIGPGDKVFVSSHTYVATASAVKFVGAKPVLADINLDDGLISADSIRSEYDGSQTAIIVTQLNGRCCDMAQIQSVCEDLNLRLFEDSAQAFGARYKGRLAGTFGEFGTFSFYPAKTLGGFGDAGAICCGSDGHYQVTRELRDHGRDTNGDMNRWGFNSRLDNIHAALLRYKLKRYATDIERRRYIAKTYISSLEKIPEVTCPPFDGKEHFDIFQNFECQFEDRDELVNFLESRNIAARIQWGGVPLHSMSKLGFDGPVDKFANCEQYFKKCLMLPIYPRLTEAQIDHVIEAICDFYGVN